MKPIGALTDVEIARLLLRCLWQVHSAGGISHGRSVDSRILESAMDLIPLPMGIMLDAYTCEDLREEGERRKRIAHQQYMLNFVHITGAE